MRVCIVTTAFPRWPGDDRGVFILEAARAVRAAGCFVRVIAMHSPNALTREVMDGIQIIRPRYLAPEPLEVLQKFGGGLPMAWHHSRFARLATLPFFGAHTLAIAQHARDCDVIHANWTLSAIAAYASQPIHRRPYVITVHGSDIYQAANFRGVARLSRIALNHSRRVLAVSQSLAQTTMALGVAPHKIEVLPDGVDTNAFCPTSDADSRAPIVLFVGALIPRKGVEYLIRAMPGVLLRFPDSRLVVIGEGPQREQLMMLAAAHALGGRVMFTGALSPNEVSQWMRRARLFVLPSLEEGLGVVLLEAMASATPVIATYVGGIPDVVRPDVGLLVPPGNADALANAVNTLLGDPACWQQMSRHARERANAEYSWSVIAQRLVDVYRQSL